MLKKIQDLGLIYLMHATMNLGMGVIGLFIPIFLLANGFTLTQTLLFLLVARGALPLATALVLKLAETYSLITILIARIFVLASYIYILLSLTTAPSFTIVVIASLIGTLEIAMYWMPYHILFIRNTDRGAIGRSVSYVKTLSSIFGLAAPVVAAIVIKTFGYSWLFSVAFGIVILSLIPIFGISRENTRVEITRKGLRDAFSENKAYFFAEAVQNFVKETVQVLLPIFVFVTLVDILSVGWVATLMSASGIILTLFIGRYSDKGHMKGMLEVGSVMLFIFLLLFAFFGTTVTTIYILSVLVGFTVELHDTPYSRLFYVYLKKNDGTFLLLREVGIGVGRTSMLLLALLFHEQLQIVFVIAGFVMLYFFWFSKTTAIE